MTGAEDTSLAPMPTVAAAISPAARRRRGRLVRKYALLFIVLVGVALVANSALDFWFSYQENKEALVRVQQEKADAAAQRIEEFIGEIERQIGWTTHAQWSAGPLDQRRFDYVRLQRQVPAITELSQLDADGKEQLKVSRLAMDVVASGQDFSASPAFTEAKAHGKWFSPVYFRKESEPYMTLAIARAGRNAGVTIAEINLKLIWNVITALEIGQGGYAYVVDGHGRLIAHPDISLVLRDTDLSKLPQVAAALATPHEAQTGTTQTGGAQTGGARVAVAKNITGRSVLTAHAAIAPLGWLIFVEVPLSEAFAPLYGAAWRTGFVLLFGLLAAALAALVLARRMTGPIRAIQAGAAQIGAGALDRRIDIHTGDELEELADQFNRMAHDLQTSYAELENKVEERTAELSEALDQQTATAEVLGVINASPGDLAPVFDAMLDKAMRLCGAAFGHLWTYDGEFFHAATLRGAPKAYADLLSGLPVAAPPGSVLGGIVAGEAVSQIPDVAAVDAYRGGNPAGQALVELGRARTVAAVPLRRDDRLLGAISVYRQEVHAFSDKQIALLQNFAAQAVIAMENARLITETREALDQQTATAELLGVINSSPGDLEPVFDAMLEKATNLCEAAYGHLMTFDGEMFQTVAVHGKPHLIEKLHQIGPLRGQPGSLGERLVRGESVVHIADAADDESYRSGSPVRRAVVEAGIRSLLGVGLRKDDALIGIIVIYREELRRFTDKQIGLLQNFAAQAVIAMENARLITETREALEQQTATAEVLQVINSSPGDLAPVFDAMLERAMRLCGAAFGEMQTYDGERFQMAALRGLPPRYAEFRTSRTHIYGPGTIPARLLAGERPVHVLDITAEDAYRNGEPNRLALADLGGARTVLAVPLLKDGAVLGFIVSYRQEVRPFTDKQIALLENFAAQAVIAIENARLITETREALDQQTATAEVLGVINSSPGDLAPVFDAMLEKAMRLCGFAHGSMQVYDGKGFRAVAVRGLPEEIADRLRDGFVPGPHHPTRRLLEGDSFVQVPDLAEVDDPTARFAAEHGSCALLAVALRKEDVLLGLIVAVRREARLFADKEIALLQNFAAQAVIAMENARLINETREALDQQTATAEVLGVINSSPGDLAPVFDTMLDKAMRLCSAAFGVMTTYDGETFRTAAHRGLPPRFAEYADTMKEGWAGAHTRLAEGADVLHLLDAKDDEAYRTLPSRRALVDLGGARTVLLVALRREDALLGSFAIYRQEVRPFSDKEIALLQNFAAQAVIAMENARLLGEIRQRQAELRVTFDNMADGVAMFDAALHLAAWNKNFQELLDLPDDFLGAPHSYADYIRYLAKRGEFGEGADPDVELRRYTERISQHTAVERTRPDGRVIEVRHNPMPEGGFVLIYSDITERKRSEAEIRASRDAAEAALRDLKAAQANLVQAEKMASLGQLTAGIAHEIKNPLNFVNNFASLSVDLLGELKETAEPGLATLDADKRADVDDVIGMLTGNLEKITEHGKRADNIVKSMLEHSRGASGERREVDLNGLVEEALNLAYHGARAQDQSFNITLERDLAGDIPPIELAPQEMTRVFLNLFGNGFYAANKRLKGGADPQFKPVLKVKTCDLGDGVEVRVRDNGTGIPPEIKDKLFQPFFTTKPTGEGTGLGLSISYDIVAQQHGGTIEVDSRLGEFTEFTIRLPRNGQAIRVAGVASAA